jgi:hypothetical protein
MDVVTVKARKILRQQLDLQGEGHRGSNPNDREQLPASPPTDRTARVPWRPPGCDGRRLTLILNEPEYEMVRTNLWAPVEHSDLCRQHQIPLKRGVLLEGRYGIGKTMTARATAKKCVENGWTFIMLSDVRGLKAALEFARRYQPAVIFAEDIDRVISDRDTLGNDLINTIDGVVNSRDEVVTVLTTNFVEKLDPSMLRPGRLDAVIRIKTPDETSCTRLIQTYARDTLKKGADISAAAKRLAESKAIPATVREVVERSKLAMVANGAKNIGAKELEIAANTMAEHLALMDRPVETTSPEERLGKAMAEVMGKAASGLDEDLVETIEETHAYANTAMHASQAAGAAARQTVNAIAGMPVVAEQVHEVWAGLKTGLAGSMPKSRVKVDGRKRYLID